MKVRPSRDYSVQTEHLRFRYTDARSAAVAADALRRAGLAPRLIASRIIVSGRDFGLFCYRIPLGSTPDETRRSIWQTLRGTLKQHQKRNSK